MAMWQIQDKLMAVRYSSTLPGAIPMCLSSSPFDLVDDWECVTGAYEGWLAEVVWANGGPPQALVSKAIWAVHKPSSHMWPSQSVQAWKNSKVGLRCYLGRERRGCLTGEHVL
jgi:hypothetical protein